LQNITDSLYQTFLKSKPLMNLFKKDEKFAWNETQDKAFRELRDLLCSEPLL